MSSHNGQRALGISFLLTLAFCLIEFAGGKISGSLALLADAGHMLTDLGAIGLALFASRMSMKRATQKMTYGFYRIEILSALINGAALLTIAVFIVKEAFSRLRHPSAIDARIMLVIASAGLLANLFCGFLLRKSEHQSINVRGAFFHIVSDALSSVGTLISGFLILWTGWHYADLAASLVIAILIVVSAWRLLKDVVEVLLEAAPGHIDVDLLRQKILSVPGVAALHDLHLWSITSGKEALSAHLEVCSGTDSDELLNRINEILARDFKIHHTTLQIESVHKRRKEDNCGR